MNSSESEASIPSGSSDQSAHSPSPHDSTAEPIRDLIKPETLSMTTDDPRSPGISERDAATPPPIAPHATMLDRETTVRDLIVPQPNETGSDDADADQS